jgi:amino-acid N-acetyltransferase
MPEKLMIRGQPPRRSTVALLEAEGLPVSDLTDSHLQHFFFTGAADSPTALVGLEIYGIDALLRSLVVSADARTQGTGSADPRASSPAFARQAPRSWSSGFNKTGEL